MSRGTKARSLRMAQDDMAIHIRSFESLRSANRARPQCRGLVIAAASACSLYKFQSQSVAFKAMATSGAMSSNIGGPSLRSNSSGSTTGSRRVQGPKPYKKRSFEDFTDHEKEHLDKLKKSSLLQKLHFLRVFKEPTEQLHSWLHFFDGVNDHPTYASELQQGLIHLWSTLIVLEALLAAVATQPFITPQNLEGWKRACYGMLWTLSLLVDFFAMGTTALFLGYLLGSPGKLSWVWLCEIGVLRGIPAVLMLLATFISLIAIGFTTFILYRFKVGIVCMVVEVFIVGAGIWFARLLSGANSKVVKSELEEV